MRSLTTGWIVASLSILTAGCTIIVTNNPRQQPVSDHVLSASNPVDVSPPPGQNPEYGDPLAPDTPLRHAPEDPRFQFSGTWTGTLHGYDAAHFIDSKGYPISFCIFIGTNSHAKVYKWDDGKWKDFGNRPYSAFHWGPQADVASLASGTDGDGTWVEGSRFTFVRYDADKATVYWLRTVNNLDIPTTAQYYYFAWGYSGRMHRVDAGGDTACGVSPPATH